MVSPDVRLLDNPVRGRDADTTCRTLIVRGRYHNLSTNCLLTEASEHTRTIKTGFDVKFKLLRRETSNFAGQTKPICEPYGIAFLIESETGGVTLYSPNPTDLLKCRYAFSPILVQTDFHSQYRAIRKIGKGNCATVQQHLFRFIWASG